MGTLICGAVFVESVEQALAAAARAQEAGADLVEYRVDDLFAGEGDDQGRLGCLTLCEQSPLPCIVTCRSPDEGGSYDGDDAARLALYEALGTSDHPPAYLDLELAAYERSANLRQKAHLAVGHPVRGHAGLRTGLILSAHDFEGRPRDLWQRVEKLAGTEAARVGKIAFRARSLRDALEACEVPSSVPKPMVSLAMGEFGVMARILAPKFGGFLTFASVQGGSETAPGQPTVRELVEDYRFRSIGRETQVYGVIGWPVGHSISPRIHNKAFERMELDKVYVPLPIAPGWESFKATVLTLLDDASLDFRGASVTLPHKEHLIRLAETDDSRAWTVDPLVKRVGAANTLVVDDEGACRVMNTDVAGAVQPLEETLGGVAGRRIAVIGAGGAGRAIATGLFDADADVLVLNRTESKAREVCEKIIEGPGLNGSRAGSVRATALEGASLDGVDAIVHATPAGMAGGGLEAENPLISCDAAGLSEDCVVFDTVYTPRETPLIEWAQRHGCRVIFGETMFARQAREQSIVWCGETGSPKEFEQWIRIVLENSRE